MRNLKHEIQNKFKIRGVFADRQAGMAGIKACRLCRPIGKNINGNIRNNGAQRPPRGVILRLEISCLMARWASFALRVSRLSAKLLPRATASSILAIPFLK